jgi:hypothetical protein
MLIPNHDLEEFYYEVWVSNSLRQLVTTCQNRRRQQYHSKSFYSRGNSNPPLNRKVEENGISK